MPILLLKKSIYCDDFINTKAADLMQSSGMPTDCFESKPTRSGGTVK